MTPAQRKSEKLRKEAEEFKESFESRCFQTHERAQEKESNRKIACFQKIKKELGMIFGDEFSLYQTGDIQHQFQNIKFKKGCKICGDSQNVEKRSCGISACKDCRIDDECIICNWLNNYYSMCQGLNGNGGCYGRNYIAPGRELTKDYHFNNKPICSSCNFDLPKNEQTLGFSEDKSKQMQLALEKSQMEQKERQVSFQEMNDFQKAQLKADWEKVQVVVQAVCSKCRQHQVCERVSCQCFPCFMHSFERYDYQYVSRFLNHKV